MESNFEYQQELNDPQWISFRDEIISRDGGVCRACGSNKDLQVHHKQYHFIEKEQKFVKPWNYNHHYLITLCKECHKIGEEKYGKVPVKFI